MKDQGCHQKVTSDVQDVEGNDDPNPNGETTNTTRPFRDDSNRHAKKAKYQRSSWEGQVSVVFHHTPKRTGILPPSAMVILTL